MCMCMWCVLGMGCVGVCGGHISLIRISIFIIDCVTVNNNTVYSYHTEQGIIHFSDKNENALVLIRKQQWMIKHFYKMCFICHTLYCYHSNVVYFVNIYILVLILPISNVNT